MVYPEFHERVTAPETTITVYAREERDTTNQLSLMSSDKQLTVYAVDQAVQIINGLQDEAGNQKYNLEVTYQPKTDHGYVPVVVSQKGEQKNLEAVNLTMSALDTFLRYHANGRYEILAQIIPSYGVHLAGLPTNESGVPTVFFEPDAMLQLFVPGLLEHHERNGGNYLHPAANNHT